MTRQTNLLLLKSCDLTFIANYLQPGQKPLVNSALTTLGSFCSARSLSPNKNCDPSISSNLSQPSRSSLIDDHWQDLMEQVVYNLPRLAWVPIVGALNFYTGLARGLLLSISSGETGTDLNASRRLFPARLAQICRVNLECLNKVDFIIKFMLVLYFKERNNCYYLFVCFLFYFK